MEKAVYIYKGGWKNANDALDIRGNCNGANTISGSTPTTKNVPKVFAYTGSGWDQIYPSKEVPSGRIRYTARRLNHYRYHSLTTANCAGPSKRGYSGNGTARVKRDIKERGWKTNGVAGQGFYEEDYNRAGSGDLSYVHYEYAGWLDLGSNALKHLPNHQNVKEITYLKLNFGRRVFTGWTSKDLTLSLWLNNEDECGYTEGTAKNPFERKVGSPINACVVTGGADKKNEEIDLGTTEGQRCANMFMSWMRGDAKSIFMMNTENCHTKYLPGGWDDWVCCSKNYLKFETFSFEIEYTTE